MLIQCDTERYENGQQDKMLSLPFQKKWPIYKYTQRPEKN